MGDKFKGQDTETIIGAGVEVEGNFAANGNITIKGSLKGSLATQADLKVEETARIEANVRARNLYLAGQLHGNVKCEERLKLNGSARLNGDVNCQTLSVDEGAVFNGKCAMGKIKEEGGEKE